MIVAARPALHRSVLSPVVAGSGQNFCDPCSGERKSGPPSAAGTEDHPSRWLGHFRGPVDLLRSFAENAIATP